MSPDFQASVINASGVAAASDPESIRELGRGYDAPRVFNAGRVSELARLGNAFGDVVVNQARFIGRMPMPLFALISAPKMKAIFPIVGFLAAAFATRHVRRRNQRMLVRTKKYF